MARLTVSVLGELQVLIDGVPVSTFESDKVRALLVYLTVEAERAHRRETLIGLLWPDCSEQAARHNLSQALFNLRLALGDHTAKPPYLLISRNAIQFNEESDYSLDVQQFNGYFESMAENLSRESVDSTTLLTQLETMVQLYRGEFLQQFFLGDSTEFEEWSIAQREILHQRLMKSLTTLVDLYERQADYAAARRFALRQLELDPWREEAHYQVMRLLALEGQRSAALAQYENCRKVLAEELGVEPSSQTRELYEQIRLETVTYKPEQPAQLFSAPLHNLPVSITPFIGREQELADLTRLIDDPECRCISLVGPGGIGKTRLALRAAEQHRNKFAQDSAFIPLASVVSIEAVVPVIANGIGFAFNGPADPKIQLYKYLRDKQLLLIMDNVEHLLVADPQQDTIANLLNEILQAASQVKLLVTSREVLNLQGEWSFEVHGLAFPEPEQTEGLDKYSAVALFAQRARRARSGFEINDENITGVVQLCRLVEGLPLAIELAAAWVRILSPVEIAQEIETSLDFLNAQMRDLPERHRSMRAVFDRSWELLTEEEQGVLLRLSTFRGGFRREAAEHVAETALSVLSTLVTKSLIRRNGAGRFDLHELIRQFAAEKLAEHPGEQTVTRAHHGNYYLTYFSEADGRLRNSAQREALEELAAEMDNFRAAWDWAVVHGEFALIEQTLRTFFMLYDTFGWFQEGLDMLGRAVDALEMAHGHSPPGITEQVALGHILADCSWFAYRLANYERAQRMLERSLEILRPLNERHVLVESLAYLGRVMEFTGNYARALELYSEGLEMATAIGDRWFATLCLTLHTALVGLSHDMVKPEVTYERLQSAVADWRLIGDPSLIAFGLGFLSRSALRLGRYDEAHAALEETIALNSSIGFGWGLGSAYRELGIVAQAQGKHRPALVMFRKSVDTFTELGGSWFVACVLAEMGRSVFALGNVDEAKRVWQESLRIATEIHGPSVALEALAGIASLQAKQGDKEHALELLLVVLNHPASLQETKDRARDLRDELEARLHPSEIKAAQQHAGSKDLEEHVHQFLAGI
ncbi:MAG TPA: tetratricopeptide repeat protein [Anaerolineales bacterium]|nr:tetratricopeptide repeat protein [Anaerolineales bacterium]